MTERTKTVLTSLDKITIPFRLILPLMMALFIYVYQKDQKIAEAARNDLSFNFKESISEIKTSIQRSDDEQRKLMGDYRDWREVTEHRLTKAEVCCWKQGQQRKIDD